MIANRDRSQRPLTGHGVLPLVLLTVWFSTIAVIPAAWAADVRIDRPFNRANVGHQVQVQGQVKTSFREVWVVVYSREERSYVVQGRVDARSQSWRMNVQIGRPGPRDASRTFQILAIADPRDRLSPGKRLSGWPRGAAQSNLVEVTRQ